MCKFASFVLTKDKCLYLPDSESHSEIIKRFEIHESGARGLNIVKVEILPPADGDLADLSKWTVTFDQDQFPEWHHAEESRERAAKHLRKKLNELTYLYASNNPLLKSLPELPKCVTLYASNNPLLKSLPELPKCVTLYAYHNPLLKSLPELPECEYLNASNNPLLKDKRVR